MKNATDVKIFFGTFFPCLALREIFTIAESLNVVFLRKKHERFGTFFPGFVMSFKKFLRSDSFSRSGQSTVEYFILLVALAVLTIVGSSTFFAKIKRSSDHVLNYSVKQMKQDNLRNFSLGGITPGGWTNTTI
jgi:Flp pilus assembly pilin Flp